MIHRFRRFNIRKISNFKNLIGSYKNTPVGTETLSDFKLRQKAATAYVRSSRYKPCKLKRF